MTRWCPAPGCDKVAYASSRSAMEHAKGIANCKNCNSFACGNGCSESNSCYFCMYCGEEPHAPCDCQTLSKWNEKNQSESETANWMIGTVQNDTAPSIGLFFFLCIKFLMLLLSVLAHSYFFISIYNSISFNSIIISQYQIVSEM